MGDAVWLRRLSRSFALPASRGRPRTRLPLWLTDDRVTMTSVYTASLAQVIGSKYFPASSILNQVQSSQHGCQSAAVTERERKREREVRPQTSESQTSRNYAAFVGSAASGAAFSSTSSSSSASDSSEPSAFCFFSCFRIRSARLFSFFSAFSAFSKTSQS